MRTTQLVRARSIHSINRSHIISAIRKHPGATRSDLNQVTGLSKATVSKLVGELLDEKILYENRGDNNRQRNTTLWPNRRAGKAIGIELSPDECRGISTDMEGSSLKHVRRELSSTRVDETIEVVTSVVNELMEGTENRVLGVALAVPGVVDTSGQRVLSSESLGWFDVPVGTKLAQPLSCPVTLINRPKAGALGEYWYGVGRGVDNLVYVSASSGVAAGIISQGQLLAGEMGVAGELGHTTVSPDGPVCACGNRGCLEAVASIPAILGAIEEALRQGQESALAPVLKAKGKLRYEDLVEAARNGDALALEHVRKASRYLGIGVSDLINILNPRMVVIGGQLAEIGEVIVTTVRETAQRRTYPLGFSSVQIVPSGLGPDSVCVGACALIVDDCIAQLALKR